MRITKKLRAEAIELAGIHATFFADRTGAWPSSGDAYYRAEVVLLVEKAERWANLHDREDLSVRMAAEAQAMLIEGWRP